MSQIMTLDTKAMREVGGRLATVNKSLHQSVSSAKQKVGTLKTVWTGNAAADFQKSFALHLKNSEEALLVLDNMLKALYKTADDYDASVKAVQNAAQKVDSLPSL